MVSYLDHRAHCKERESALKEGAQENDDMQRQWRIVIRNHKTGHIGEIELVWSDVFHKIVINWISTKGLTKQVKPFHTLADWRKLSSLLKKMVDPELFALTKGNLGLKDFRRLAIKKIMESDQEVELKLRTIGKANSRLKIPH